MKSTSPIRTRHQQPTIPIINAFAIFKAIYIWKHKQKITIMTNMKDLLSPQNYVSTNIATPSISTNTHLKYITPTIATNIT